MIRDETAEPRYQRATRLGQRVLPAQWGGGTLAMRARMADSNENDPHDLSRFVSAQEGDRTPPSRLLARIR